MEHERSAFRGHLLSFMQKVGEAVDTNLLAELGIFDAEQLLGALSVPGISGRLSRFLKVSSRQLDLIAEMTINALPRNIVLTLAEAVDPTYALGAFIKPTPDSKRLARSLFLKDTGARGSEYVAANNLAMLGAVKDQGARGTCVAFAATAMHERYFSDIPAKIDFSEQYLHAKIKAIDRHPNECGTWLVYAAKVLVELGQCVEGGSMSYNPNLPCNDTTPIQAPYEIDARQYKISIRMLQAIDVSLMKSLIFDGGVVPACIPVFDSWYRSPEAQRSGRITMPVGSESPSGGHCVCLAGFQNTFDYPGGGYFIFRNSWGAGWGRACPYGAGNGIVPYAYISSFCSEAATGPTIGSK